MDSKGNVSPSQMSIIFGGPMEKANNASIALLGKTICVASLY